MYCPQCGTSVADGLNFCPRCGAQLGGGAGNPDSPGGGGASSEISPTVGAGTTYATASAPEAPGAASSGTPDAATPGTPAPDTLSAQVSRAQKHSKRRLPMLLIVILVTLALAAAAFAATYVYQNVILPQLEEQAQQQAEEDLAAEQQAEQDAQAAEEARQRAVYNDILTTYRDAQAQGWQNASSSTLNDLAALGAIVDLQEDMNVSVTYDELMGGTVAYTYTDLGNDGTLDLVIGVLSGNGDAYKLIGAFSTDGSTTTSLMNGSLLMRVTWDVDIDGYLRSVGADGADAGSVTLYTVEDGNPVIVQHLGWRDGSYFTYNDDGTTSPVDESEVSNARNAAQTDFDLNWTPLEDFEPVVSDGE